MVQEFEQAETIPSSLAEEKRIVTICSVSHSAVLFWGFLTIGSIREHDYFDGPPGILPFMLQNKPLKYATEVIDPTPYFSDEILRTLPPLYLEHAAEISHQNGQMSFRFLLSWQSLQALQGKSLEENSEEESYFRSLQSQIVRTNLKKFHELTLPQLGRLYLKSWKEKYLRIPPWVSQESMNKSEIAELGFAYSLPLLDQKEFTIYTAHNSRYYHQYQDKSYSALEIRKTSNGKIITKSSFYKLRYPQDFDLSLLEIAQLTKSAPDKTQYCLEQ